MKSLKKERLSQMVIEAIEQMIESEGLRPGDRFYSENQLCKRLEVSRSSIREAVRMLEVAGKVEVHQGKGIFITEPAEPEFPIKRWVVDNTDLLKEHFEVRLLIEPHAASEAASKALDREIDELEKTYDSFCQQLESHDIAGAIACDGEFHQQLARLSKNRTLSVLMKTMAQTLNEGWIASLNTPGRLERTVEEHKLVLQAVREHDAPEAARLMKEHLSKALSDIQRFTQER